MANLYTPESVGNILGVTPVTLHHWRKNGIGPAWFKRGQFYYYRANQLQEYLDKIGPIPTGDLNEKRRFFADAHRAEMPEEAATVAELAARLAVVEKTLARLRSRRASGPRSTERKRARQHAGLTI